MISLGFERSELARLQKRFERVFSVLGESLEAEAMESYGTFMPLVDIFETKEAVQMTVELTGVEIGKLELTLSAKELSIDGVKKGFKANSKGNFAFLL